MGDHPMRIQRKRVAGFRLPAGVVCVTRPGPWSNPFRVDGEAAKLLARGIAAAHERDEGWARRMAAQSLYRLWLDDRLHELPAERLYLLATEALRLVGNPLRPSREDIREHLAGRDLACWCGPDDPCHADVLIEIANPAMTFELAGERS